MHDFHDYHTKKFAQKKKNHIQTQNPMIDLQIYDLMLTAAETLHSHQFQRQVSMKE